MKSKDLAEFHNVHERTTRKWPKEQRHQKTIQAEADVTPIEWRLVGEIAQLCYLYNAQGWEGINAVTWASFDMNSHRIAIYIYAAEDTRLMTASTSSAVEMKLIKLQLEKLVY